MAKRLNIAKKKKYTIVEGMNLYEIISNQKNINVSSTQIWNKLANQNIFPERTAESLKNFWKKMHHKTLEEFLIESI